VIEIRKTERFARWLDGLRDLRGRARIQARIERLAAGNSGNAGPVGEGVSELRIDYGPGYRVYFKRREGELIILLAGGDKSTQARDIKAALRLARNLSEERAWKRPLRRDTTFPNT
jgi:putative addiction module killer protein